MSSGISYSLSTNSELETIKKLMGNGTTDMPTFNTSQTVQIVTIDWLRECLKQKKKVKEFNFRPPVV
jgi:tRNA C32,U32 (ribose-2'-O)-methylase TrmJ